MTTNTGKLIRQFIGGDPAAAADIVDRAPASDDVLLLVAAALITPAGPPNTSAPLLTRAAQQAATTSERQLVALAEAHLRGDRELVDALARDHLADHPGNVLVSWIAASSAAADRPAAAG